MTTTQPQAALLSAKNPLLKRCYTMSEPHLSGYRVVIGFERLEDAQDAHEYIAKLQAQAAQGEPVKPLFASKVAARKWAELQDGGARMQSIAFDGANGGAGTIDPWGIVRWGQAAPVVPDGYALISVDALPVHETKEMHDAVMSVLYSGVARTETDKLWQAYRSAMLTAYPAAPAQAQQSEPSPASEQDIAVYQSIADGYKTQAQQAGELPDEREAFEREMCAQHGLTPVYFRRNENGYQNMATESAWTGWQARAALAARKPLTGLTREQMEAGRHQVFSTNNPFCPCDSKTFRKVSEWTEREFCRINGLEVKP